MTCSHSSDDSLSWYLKPGSRWVYHYSHQREVQSRSWFGQAEISSEREAEMIISVEHSSQRAQLFLTKVSDHTRSGDTDNPPMSSDKVFPVINFDKTGRIEDNFSPVTFPYVFAPELTGLKEGSSKSEGHVISLKSGFGRQLARGPVTTIWERSDILHGSLCAVLVTTFELKTKAGKAPWSPKPASFKGTTVVHFDRERGRPALIASSTLTEQSVGFYRVLQNIEMTMRIKEQEEKAFV